jgi:hypothetical protein
VACADGSGTASKTSDSRWCQRVDEGHVRCGDLRFDHRVGHVGAQVLAGHVPHEALDGLVEPTRGGPGAGTAVAADEEVAGSCGLAQGGEGGLGVVHGVRGPVQQADERIAVELVLHRPRGLGPAVEAPRISVSSAPRRQATSRSTPSPVPPVSSWIRRATSSRRFRLVWISISCVTIAVRSTKPPPEATNDMSLAKPATGVRSPNPRTVTVTPA